MTAQLPHREDTAAPVSTAIRIVLSTITLSICWVVAGILFALYLKDVRAAVAFYISTVSLFVVSWFVVGLPIVASGSKILRIPKLLLGTAGALGGTLILMSLDNSLLSSGKLGNVLLAFSAGIGAVAVLIYRLLLERFPK